MLVAPPATGEEAVAACNALGLFSGGGRLVVVEGVESWRAAGRRGGRARTSPTPRPAPCSRCGRTRRRRAARSPTLVGKRGQVLSYDVPRPRSPSAWVAGEFKRLGLEVDADAARALVEIVGDDVLMLASEIEKIATWAAGQPIGVREIEALAVPAREVEAWARHRRLGSPGPGRRAGRVRGVARAARSRSRSPSSLASHVGRVRGRAAARRGGPRRARGREAARPAERVPGAQGARALRELLARGARRRDRPAGGARRGDQGREPARRRAGARARARGRDATAPGDRGGLRVARRRGRRAGPPAPSCARRRFGAARRARRPCRSSAAARRAPRRRDPCRRPRRPSRAASSTS